jgi:hypothetical protein
MAVVSSREGFSAVCVINAAASQTSAARAMMQPANRKHRKRLLSRALLRLYAPFF